MYPVVCISHYLSVFSISSMLLQAHSFPELTQYFKSLIDILHFPRLLTPTESEHSELPCQAQIAKEM